MKDLSLMVHLKRAIWKVVYGCVLGQVRASYLRAETQKSHEHLPKSTGFSWDCTKRY
jgi:hypothetical protein